jgi:hypothetical protein
LIRQQQEKNSSAINGKKGIAPPFPAMGEKRIAPPAIGGKEWLRQIRKKEMAPLARGRKKLLRHQQEKETAPFVSSTRNKVLHSAAGRGNNESRKLRNPQPKIESTVGIVPPPAHNTEFPSGQIC